MGITLQGGPKIVTGSMSLCLDSYSTKSYSGTSAWNDLTLNNLTGSIIGATFSENSLLFNGIGNYVSVVAGVNTSPRANNFTVSAWFKTIYTPVGNSNIISNYPPFPNRSFYAIYFGSNGCLFGFIRDSAQNTVVPTSTKVVSDGNWHNATLIRDGSGGKLYIDGILDSTDTNLSLNDLNLDSNSLNIGRNSATNGQYFKGNIQTTYYYNRALSPTEVLQNYLALKTRFDK